MEPLPSKSAEAEPSFFRRAVFEVPILRAWLPLPLVVGANSQGCA